MKLPSEKGIGPLNFVPQLFNRSSEIRVGPHRPSQAIRTLSFGKRRSFIPQQDVGEVNLPIISGTQSNRISQSVFAYAAIKAEIIKNKT
jgi:hypothetical protein